MRPLGWFRFVACSLERNTNLLLLVRNDLISLDRKVAGLATKQELDEAISGVSTALDDELTAMTAEIEALQAKAASGDDFADEVTNLNGIKSRLQDAAAQLRSVSDSSQTSATTAPTDAGSGSPTAAPAP